MKTTIILVLSMGTWFNQGEDLQSGSTQKVPSSNVAAVDIQQDSSQQLIKLVKDAAQMVRSQGEAAFEEFRNGNFIK